MALLGTIKHTLTVVQVVAVMADLLHRQEQQILAVVEAVMAHVAGQAGGSGVVIIAAQQAAATLTGTYTVDTSGRSGGMFIHLPQARGATF